MSLRYHEVAFQRHGKSSGNTFFLIYALPMSHVGLPDPFTLDEDPALRLNKGRN